MSTIRMRLPKGAGGLEGPGYRYLPDAHGFVHVEEKHVSHAERHGAKRTPEEPKPAAPAEQK